MWLTNVMPIKSWATAATVATPASVTTTVLPFTSSIIIVIAHLGNWKPLGLMLLLLKPLLIALLSISLPIRHVIAADSH
jgi:hypothetical protein